MTSNATLFKDGICRVTMVNSVDIGIIENKLEKLGAHLREHCTRNNLNRIGSFLLMFNEEQGENISYVKDMGMAEMGWTMNFYDKTSQHYRSKHDGIEWPYSGFVRGVVGEPILISHLAEWLERSPYLEEPSPLRKNFVMFYEELIHKQL